jgi:ribose/xylose/arabinose/galactoside ABC-type transport system permease subunit
VFKDPGFFSIAQINNGVLYGRLVDVFNRGSEIAILAVGQTLVVAVSAGTDISVGSVMSLAACGGCMVLAGYGVNTSVTSDRCADPGSAFWSASSVRRNLRRIQRTSGFQAEASRPWLPH